MTEFPKFVSAEEKYLDLEGPDWQKMSEFNNEPEAYTRSLIEEGFSISEVIDDLQFCIHLLMSNNVATANSQVTELLTTFTRVSHERHLPIFRFLKNLGVPKIALQNFLRERYEINLIDSDEVRKERAEFLYNQQLVMLDALYENAAD